MDHTDLGFRAKSLRRQPTPFEVMLWRQLSASKLGGFKFRCQAVIGPYICDFFCPSKGLIIEVDGDTHDPIKDRKRDDMLMSEYGFATLRFTNREVADNMTGVLETILSTLLVRPDRWTGPTPTPPLKGRGYNLI